VKPKPNHPPIDADYYIVARSLSPGQGMQLTTRDGTTATILYNGKGRTADSARIVILAPKAISIAPIKTTATNAAEAHR